MSKPSVIVFDLGKVLVDFDYSIAARKILARSSVQIEQSRLFTDQLPLLLRYENGELTTREFVAALMSVTGYSGSTEDFEKTFGDIFAPIEPMIALHATLRQKGFPTFILSNTNELAVRHVTQNFPFFANFDGYIYSHEVRSMKPDARIYEALEEMAGKRGGDLLYIDDRPENIEAGIQRGWRTILHETPEKTKAFCQQLGLL